MPAFAGMTPNGSPPRPPRPLRFDVFHRAENSAGLSALTPPPAAPRYLRPMSHVAVRRLAVALLALATACRPAVRPAATPTPQIAPPPAVSREFRGVWIATVNNIDWPSRPG